YGGWADGGSLSKTEKLGHPIFGGQWLEIRVPVPSCRVIDFIGPGWHTLSRVPGPGHQKKGRAIWPARFQKNQPNKLLTSGPF
ncbi:hypothetical protein V1387_18175, partial [Allomuricauda taeanensis]|uniref:hypothetical protein n=1 Tax=Flagellimonas taeanensis TaxID=1005926 RepID=UPI002E7B368B